MTTTTARRSSTYFELLLRLNLNHLPGFLAIAEKASFRAAAAQIHISQSALSVQIRQLERELGVRLFHRTTRSVNLSAEGQRFYAVARRIGEELGQVALELKEEAQLQRGVVVVAVLPSLAYTLMPIAMRGFAQRHPGVEVRLRDGDSKRCAELVRHGDADMGVMSRDDELHELAFTLLFHDGFVALVPLEGHPLSGRKSVSLADLARFPLLLNPRGVDLRENLETMFRAEGIIPEPAQELTGTHALAALVASGFGVSIQPRMALTGLDTRGCRILTLRGGGGRDIGVMLPARRSHSPATLALQGFLREEALSAAKMVGAAVNAKP